MQITSFQIRNYKSFRETQQVSLTPGMNVITGQNNAGKTALLQALSLQVARVPHRSINSLPSRSTLMTSSPRFSFSVSLEREELLRLLSGQDVLIPLPIPRTQSAGVPTLADVTHPSLDRFMKWFFSRDSYSFSLELQSLENHGHWNLLSFPSFGLYRVQGDHNVPGLNCHVWPDHTTEMKSGPQPVQMNRGSEIGAAVAANLSRLIYRFAAERFNLGLCNFGSSSMLAPQSANLPEVLGVLQSNAVAFDVFNFAVKEIFPLIGRITVVPEGSNRQKIVVWSEVAYRKAREDLAISLDDSGTGIGQVLAILYVVLTSHFPQLLLIDEPQSFLHPGAARKLIEVLKRNPQHQYVIATHSPTIITAAEPKTIILVKHDGNESTLERLDARDAEHLRRYLNEIGASLADVFGADNILWVEGPTEEQCFPRIIDALVKKPLMGTVVKAVIATGDLEGKHAERFFEIYSRLSAAQSLLPPALGFIFDDEGRSEQAKKELRSRGQGNVYFIKRRMFENYLLDPKAIAHVLNTTDGHSKVVTESEVTTQLDECLQDPHLFAPLKPEGGIAWIHACKVLKRIFWDLADLEFRKTTHSPELTEWLLENDSSVLSEVGETIAGVLGRKLTRST